VGLTVTMKNNYKYNIGLACMRLQPFHTGHQRMIDKILSECKTCYILIGSAQEQDTERNPISYVNRKRLLENYYMHEWISGRLEVMPADDINDLPNWSKYIVDKIQPIVEKYYAGTESDAEAFIKYPPNNYPKIEIDILRREDFPQFISATEIRKLFKQNNPVWKLYIPKGNVGITELLLNGEHPFPELEKLEKEMGGEIT